MNSHVLEIEFPDETPLLEPPTNVQTREAPPHDQRRLGITQSACYLCHKITEFGPNPLRGEAYDSTSRRKLAFFAHLAYGPARSLLRAVAFHDARRNRNAMRLSFCVWYGDIDGCGRESYTYDVEVLQSRWDGLVRGAGESESENSLAGLGSNTRWIPALDELVTRSSDRAYYHVRNRLVADHGEEAAGEEEASWVEEWAGISVREDEVEEEERERVEEIGELMEGVELERVGEGVDEVGRLLRRVGLDDGL